MGQWEEIKTEVMAGQGEKQSGGTGNKKGWKEELKEPSRQESGSMTSLWLWGIRLGPSEKTCFLDNT